MYNVETNVYTITGFLTPTPPTTVLLFAPSWMERYNAT